MTTIEELDISFDLYAKLKRKGINFVSQIKDFPLKNLKKAELTELLVIFLRNNDLLEKHVQMHADDQVMIHQMDIMIDKYKKSLKEIVELSKHDGESKYLDKCYVVANNTLK